MKYSKTDQRRMAATTIVVGPSGDTTLCPLQALLTYMGKNPALGPTTPLFLHNTRATTYAQLRQLVDAGL